MFSRILKRYRPGARLKAAEVNRAVAAAERASKLSVSAPLAMSDGPGGPQVYLANPNLEIDAEVSSGTDAGPYTFTQQIPASGGGWDDGWITGEAYNDQGVTPSTLPVVTKVYWSTAAEWRFSAC